MMKKDLGPGVVNVPDSSTITKNLKHGHVLVVAPSWIARKRGKTRLWTVTHPIQ